MENHLISLTTTDAHRTFTNSPITYGLRVQQTNRKKLTAANSGIVQHSTTEHCGLFGDSRPFHCHGTTLGKLATRDNSRSTRRDTLLQLHGYTEENDKTKTQTRKTKQRSPKALSSKQHRRLTQGCAEPDENVKYRFFKHRSELTSKFKNRKLGFRGSVFKKTKFSGLGTVFHVASFTIHLPT